MMMDSSAVELLHDAPPLSPSDDVPHSVYSLDTSPQKAGRRRSRLPQSPSIESIPILLDSPEMDVHSNELEHEPDTPRAGRITQQVSKWSLSTATGESEPLGLPPSSPEVPPKNLAHKRSRAGTFGSAELSPSTPTAHPCRPPSSARKRASFTGFEPRRHYARRESTLTPPVSRPSTATTSHRAEYPVPHLSRSRPSTAPALRQTRSAFTIIPPARPNTAVQPIPTRSPANFSVASPSVVEKQDPLTKQVLSLIIDQEGHREIEASFVFARFDAKKRLYEYRPLYPTASPFHSSFQTAPVLRRLLLEATGRTDFLTRQATLSVKKEGLHSVQGSDGKRTWRFVYEVAARKNLMGRPLRGEMTLRPLCFICTPEMLATEVSIKHKMMRAVKSMALPRLSSQVLELPKRAAAPTGFAWVEPVPPGPGPGSMQPPRMLKTHSSPVVPQQQPRPMTARPALVRPRTDSLIARPSTAGARPSTADRTLLFRLA